jgi:hypothetical protein
MDEMFAALNDSQRYINRKLSLLEPGATSWARTAFTPRR